MPRERYASCPCANRCFVNLVMTQPEAELNISADGDDNNDIMRQPMTLEHRMS